MIDKRIEAANQITKCRKAIQLFETMDNDTKDNFTNYIKISNLLKIMESKGDIAGIAYAESIAKKLRMKDV